MTTRHFFSILLAVCFAGSVLAETAVLTQAEIQASTAHSNYEQASITSLSGTWSGNMKVNTNTGYLQIAKNANNYYVGSPIFAGAVTKVVITTCAATETARRFYLRGNTNTPQPSSGNYGSGYTIGENGTATIDVTGSPTSFYIYANGYAAISSITVTYTAPEPCTPLDAPTLNGDVLIGETSATITWNAVTNATSYELKIYESGEDTPIATQTVNTTTYTNSSLTANTDYTFSVMAVGNGINYCDSDNTLLEGNFKTDPGSATGIDQADHTASATKILRDGRLIILRGNSAFTAQGQKVDL